jgi:hypothetical protein
VGDFKLVRKGKNKEVTCETKELKGGYYQNKM